MNSTRNSLSSSSILIWVEASSAIPKPSRIWMSGEDIFGTSWSMTDEARTAASNNNASMSAST